MAVLRAVFLGLVGAVVALARDPTYSDWLEVEVLIQQAINASTCDEDHPAWDPNLKKEHNNQLCECTPTGTSFPTKRNPKPLGSRLLRLAFHDAAGRMDAYVNMSLEENAGLDVATNILDNKYNSFNLATGEAIKDVLDKADFYAWSYIAAVRHLAFLQTMKGGATEVIYPVIPITWGRVAYNPGDDVPDEAFPPKGGHSTRSEILDYFSQDFGYSTSEVVTLLGAHTLGGAVSTPVTSRHVDAEQEYPRRGLLQQYERPHASGFLRAGRVYRIASLAVHGNQQVQGVAAGADGGTGWLSVAPQLWRDARGRGGQGLPGWCGSLSLSRPCLSLANISEKVEQEKRMKSTIRTRK